MDNYKNREFLEPQEDGTYKYVEWTCLTCPPEDYVEIPEGAEFYMQMRVGLKAGCQFFFKFDDEDLRVLSGSGWQHASYDSIQEYVDEGDQLLWSRETVKKDPALISGADALRALADGEEVEASTECSPTIWEDAANYSANEFLAEETAETEDYCSMKLFFRLKPQTIKLDLELPKPFEPKDGEVYYYLKPSNAWGFGCGEWGDDSMQNEYIQYGAWPTKEDVLKVVEQLRKIRGTNS
ncbi:hypothetical protein [Acinetobacter pittii]|uniref:hypothetical protein n=1 Tax=Acinetobacter pittii TaxID=48296 RepID=UPI0025B1B764|nr:hypothetical protein [Acinetobacter pittii]